MIVNAIELKKKILLGDLLKGEATYQGNPGDYLVTTSGGNQGIIAKEIFKEIISQSFGIPAGIGEFVIATLSS
jgi:hypothetical protein